MTRKESQRLGALVTRPERAMISEEHRNLLARIYKSEMQKLMYLHGCDIDRGMLDIINNGYAGGCSDKMVLLASPRHGEAPRIVAAYSFRMVEAYDDWKKNNLSLVKTLEKKNQFARYERGGNEADGCTFLSFVKSIKAFCMGREAFGGVTMVKVHGVAKQLPGGELTLLPENDGVSVANIYASEEASVAADKGKSPAVRILERSEYRLQSKPQKPSGEDAPSVQVANIYAQRRAGNAELDGGIYADTKTLAMLVGRICDHYPDLPVYLPCIMSTNRGDFEVVDAIGCGKSGGNWSEIEWELASLGKKNLFLVDTTTGRVEKFERSIEKRQGREGEYEENLAMEGTIAEDSIEIG